MPPKKLSSKLTSQGSAAIPAAPPGPTARLPLPPPVLPANEAITPLWMPAAPPTAVFPEWPASDTFAPEHWHSFDAPFQDPLPTSALPLPLEVRGEREAIQWKRPREFLPPIVDPTPPPAPPPLAAVHPDPKNAKKAAAAPPKKAEADKKAAAAAAAPPPTAPPKHAHVFYVDSKAANDQAPPATLDPRRQLPHHHIPRDFRRLWSSEQVEALEQWRKEEARVQAEKQQRERVLMAFEDAIAYIVNERPRGMLDDVDIDPDDLVDDGHDDDQDGGHVVGDGAGGSDASPWGVLPPAPIEIMPNAVLKPEIPHGEVVQADMASYFRIVEQLFDAWQLSDASDGSQGARPFLWHAIYPQDARGFPVYSPGGKYSVKLFVLGKWRQVDVDDRLPVDSSGKIVYATSSVANEIWPALLTKAVYKAMNWLQVSGSGADDDQGGEDAATYATRVAAHTLLLLTGWKVSRWIPGASTSFCENVYHQLLQFVPRTQQPLDDCSGSAPIDGSIVHDSGEAADGSASERQQLSVDGAVMIDEAEATTSPDGNSAPAREMKPRALICSADDSDASTRSPLRFCEAAILSDIVGDSGNTTFKIVRHGTPVSISEDAAMTVGAAANAFALLLVHPPPAHVASVAYTWTEVVSGNDSQFVPFENPPVQFAVVQLLARKADSDDHDQDDCDEEQARPSVVATLTPVLGRTPHESDDGSKSASASASRAVAKLLRLDPRGSVSLIEEPIEASRGGKAPALVSLDTVSSFYFDLAPANGPSATMCAFRVCPQRPLVRFGYCLELESSSVASIQLVGAAGFWRALGRLHVEETTGAYPVLLPNSWNVLVQQLLIVDPVATRDETQQDGQYELELRVALHVSDAELTRFVHVSVVNNATAEVTWLPALCCDTRIPLVASADAAAFTVIVDCSPGPLPVRAGAWRLTVGCSRNFTLTPTPASAVSVTTFGGVYEPNSQLVLFRDVVTSPVKAVATSFQLEVIESSEVDAVDDRVAQGLAVQLQVFDGNTTGDADAATKPLALVQASGKGVARLLQLPRPPTTAGRLVLQASIDRRACDVPAWLRSRRPFRNSTAQPPLVSSGASRINEAEDVASDERLGDGAKRKASALQWRLRVWSTDEVKMEVDRSKELRHEAIRARWAEQARDRETSGAASRLLFLGQHAAAETRLQQEQSLTEERAEALRSRFTWLRNVLDRVDASDRKLLETTTTSANDATVVARLELEANELELAEQLRLAQEQLEDRRAARAAAKEQRAAEWTADAQRVVAGRAAAAKLRAERRQELADAVAKSAA